LLNSVPAAAQKTYQTSTITVKVKAIPLHAWTVPRGCRRLRLSEFLDSWHWKVTYLSGLARAAFTPKGYSCYSFLLEAESTWWPSINNA